MDDIKLKPCPFCGGSAYLRCEGTYYWVECEFLNDCRVRPVTDCFGTKSEAIKVWNRRAGNG